MIANSYLFGILVALCTFANPGRAAQLVGGASGSCVNLPEHGGTAPDGTPVRLFQCHSNGQIIGIGGKCLDVSGGGTADTTPLIIAPCSASPSQQWSVQ